MRSSRAAFEVGQSTAQATNNRPSLRSQIGQDLEGKSVMRLIDIAPKRKMQSLRLDAFQMLIGLRRPCAVSERMQSWRIGGVRRNANGPNLERALGMDNNNEPCSAGGTESRGAGD